MTYTELKKWVLQTQNVNEETSIAMQESNNAEEFDEIIDGMKICYLPFFGHVIEKHKMNINGKPWPDKKETYLSIELVKENYTWADFIKWIEKLDNQDIIVEASAAWHSFKVKNRDNLLMAIE